MNTLNARHFAIALLAGVALAGCSKKPPASLPPEPGPATTQTAPETPQGPVPGSAADFVAQMMGQDTIHFDTDKYDIDPTDQAALQAQAAWLQKYPAKRATLEGHTDERGTREYNLGLGSRRANSIRDYLVNRGVAASRIATISYGKEKPIDPGTSEEAYQRNRNGRTALVSGAR